MGALTSKQRTLLILFISILIVLGLSLLLALNLDLGASRAKADTSSGEFTYTATDLSFRANGEFLGKPQQRGSSIANPYSTSSFKALQEIKFSAQNLPLNSLVRFCVESLASGMNDQLICKSINLAESATTEWTMSLTKSILVDAAHDYYCSAEVELLSQAIALQDLPTASVFGCELKFVPVAEEPVLISVNSNLFSQSRQGTSLVPDLSYTAAKDFEFGALYASLGVDTSLAGQSLTEICTVAASGKVCWPDHFADNPGSVTGDLIQEVKLAVKSGEKFNFSCNTQEGRRGNCQIFAYINIPAEELRALSEPNLAASEFVNLDAAEVSKYCDTDLIYYENDVNFSTYQGDVAKAGRCKQLLQN